MNDETDCELTRNQWDALKALRTATSQPPRIDRFTLEGLVRLELVAVRGDTPTITLTGRKVLVRGSSRLLDLAA